MVRSNPAAKGVEDRRSLVGYAEVEDGGVRQPKLFARWCLIAPTHVSKRRVAAEEPPSKQKMNFR
jgi:hypothetical protein